MPFTDKFLRLPCAAILPRRQTRQREEGLKLDRIIPSIQEYGVMNPILVDEEFHLIAGERRLEASRQLGLLDIPVRFKTGDSLVEDQLFELTENVQRENLNWKDQANSIFRIHQMYLSLDPDWTQSETAGACCLADATISICLTVAEALADPAIANATGLREAYNKLVRRKQRLQGDALAELAGMGAEILPPGEDEIGEALPQSDPIAYPGGKVELESLPEVKLSAALLPEGETLVPVPRPLAAAPRISLDPILCQSFLDWSQSYSGAKFNLVHCDFPYGVNLFDGPQGAGAEPGPGYGDSEEIYFSLLEAFCSRLDTFMALSSHLMFWYSEKHGEATRKIFAERAPSLQFSRHPLIWHKTDNAGISTDARRWPRHTYETCLLASRSGRQIVKIVADSYGAPTDKRLHPSTKPESVLRHFMTMFVDENTAVFDPTCGSGSALRAAESLGARRSLGLEIDPEICASSNKACKAARSLRAVS